MMIPKLVDIVFPDHLDIFGRLFFPEKMEPFSPGTLRSFQRCCSKTWELSSDPPKTNSKRNCSSKSVSLVIRASGVSTR